MKNLKTYLEDQILNTWWPIQDVDLFFVTICQLKIRKSRLRFVSTNGAVTLSFPIDNFSSNSAIFANKCANQANKATR